MAGDEHQQERADDVRRAIALLEASLRLCREHLSHLEAGARARDTRLEHLFFKPDPSREGPQSRS